MPKPITIRARSLRKNPTEAEKRLWSRLRKRQLLGIQFRRQYPVGPYIADFASTERMLIIELDGGQHAAQATYDRTRDDFIRRQGFRVLRYWNNQVFEELETVLEDIRIYLDSPP